MSHAQGPAFMGGARWGLLGRVFAGLALASILLHCAGAPPGPGPAIVGRVVSPDGAALSDVKVETEPPTDRVLTGVDGRFEISRMMPGSTPLPKGRYRIRLTRDGFLEPEEALEAPLDKISIDLGTIEMPSDDGLRVAPVDAVTEIDAGDAAAAGGEVGRGF